MGLGQDQENSRHTKITFAMHALATISLSAIRVCLSGGLALTAATLWTILAAGPARAVDFAHDVVPILRVHCGKCHTGAARQGGFSLNTRETTLAGGDTGTPGFVVGKAAESELIARVTSTDADYRMPSALDGGLFVSGNSLRSPAPAAAGRAAGGRQWPQ